MCGLGLSNSARLKNYIYTSNYAGALQQENIVKIFFWGVDGQKAMGGRERGERGADLVVAMKGRLLEARRERTRVRISWCGTRERRGK
jgi:hypothetical protein